MSFARQRMKSAKEKRFIHGWPQMAADEGTEVLPFARRRSLRVVEHHPAGLATTNEWILLLEKV